MKDIDVSTPLATLRESYASGRTRPVAWRLAQLRRLGDMLVEHESEFIDAMHADLGRPGFESWVSEIGFLSKEIRHTIKHLPKWVKPEKVSTPLVVQPGKSWVVREPFGVALIIGPWNYPVQLILAPLIGAIAAGNCAVIKPSEIAPHSAAAIARWMPEYLDASCFAVIQGGVAETTALLAEPFDYLFFTGGAAVARIVMEAAAKHLTPVTLELGGKSPCIVDEDADIDVAARRIVWGRFLNAGQTCVAPDYVLVHKSIEDELIRALGSALRKFYGEDPRQSEDYGRIINAHHFERVRGLLDSGEVVVGGEHDAEQRYIAPTILKNVPVDSPVMQEEIFGPVLPVLAVVSVEEAIESVNSRPKPLTLYLFSKNESNRRNVIDRTSSGAVCLNDVVTYMAVPGLPFGGVGLSGMGAYHGRHTFETFSHRKAVLKRTTRFEVDLLYPPYTAGKRKWLRRLVGGQ